ncbi:MAG TPA: SRPBCC domain-containing protein [Caulobacteraceae bacterium]|nr:SRPBCC domain-containing protein [Caulobacteraceae bacterium]
MTSLTLVRRIAARPSVVFDALTTADGIASWWGPEDLPVTVAEIDARAGGAYRVRFRTSDGLEHEACGECLEVTKPVRVVMSWRWALGGAPEEFGRVSRIEIDLRPIESGTELTFTHADLRDAASRDSHEWGWTGSLAKLVRHLTEVPVEHARG